MSQPAPLSLLCSLLQSLCLSLQEGRDNAPSPRRSMSPCWCFRVPSMKSMKLFLGSKDFWQSSPKSLDLRKQLLALPHQPRLQNLLRLSLVISNEQNRKVSTHRCCRRHCFFQLGHVKNWVYLASSRQLESVGHCSHALKHFKWSKETKTEFVRRSWSHRSLDVWL